MAPDSANNTFNLETLRAADLRWLEDTVLANPDCPLGMLTPRARSHVADVFNHLVQFADRAARHEAVTGQVELRNEAIADYAERVAAAAARSKAERRLVRVLRRMHSPRSWLLRQIKVRASRTAVLPSKSPNECTLGSPRPRKYGRNFSICVHDCDAAFYRETLELSFAELGFLVDLPKSTVESSTNACVVAQGRRLAKAQGPVPAELAPPQVAHLWDSMRGVAVRAAPGIAFSWRRELRDFVRSLWLRWR